MSDNRTIFFIIGLLLGAVAGGMLLPAMTDAAIAISVAVTVAVAGTMLL